MKRLVCSVVLGVLALAVTGSGAQGATLRVTMSSGSTVWGTCAMFEKRGLLPANMKTAECVQSVLERHADLNPTKVLVGTPIDFPTAPTAIEIETEQELAFQRERIARRLTSDVPVIPLQRPVVSDAKPAPPPPVIARVEAAEDVAFTQIQDELEVTKVDLQQTRVELAKVRAALAERQVVLDRAREEAGREAERIETLRRNLEDREPEWLRIVANLEGRLFLVYILLALALITLVVLGLQFNRARKGIVKAGRMLEALEHQRDQARNNVRTLEEQARAKVTTTVQEPMSFSFTIPRMLYPNDPDVANHVLLFDILTPAQAKMFCGAGAYRRNIFSHMKSCSICRAETMTHVRNGFSRPPENQHPSAPEGTVPEGYAHNTPNQTSLDEVSEGTEDLDQEAHEASGSNGSGSSPSIIPIDRIRARGSERKKSF